MRPAIKRILQHNPPVPTPVCSIPLQSSLSFTGTGSATFSRASTASLSDFENVIRTAKSGEIRFGGARRVENILPNSNAGANWQGLGTSPPTVNTSDTYNGKACVSVIFPAGVSGFSGTRASANLAPVIPIKTGSSYRDRFTIAADRALVNSESLVIYYLGAVSDGAVTLYPSRNLSTKYKVFSGGLVSHTSNVSIYPVIFVAGALESPITIYIADRQLVDVTGQSNNVSPEFASVGVLSEPYHGANADGVKYFNTKNGNTVSNNIVTEASGSPISNILGYLSEGQRTNYFRASGAPATQTIDLTTPGVGSYTVRVTGTGSVTSSAGTATGTGFGTASAGADNVFSLSAAGTVVFTVSGSPTTVQVEKGSFASTYIATTTASVTRSPDPLAYPTTSNLPANNFYLKLDWTPPNANMGTVFIWGTYVDVNNYTALLHDGTNLIFRKRISGVNYEVSKAFVYQSLLKYTLIVKQKSTTGMSLWINSIRAIDLANTTDAQISTTLQIGADGNGSNQDFSYHKNLAVYNQNLTQRQIVRLGL